MAQRKMHIDLSSLDGPDGMLPAGAQGRMARFAGRIVSFANLLPPGEVHGSGLPCRRRPRRRPCRGRLEVGREAGPPDDVHWYCPACRDSGTITGWRSTRWDITPDLQSGQVVSLFQRQAQRASHPRPSCPVHLIELDAELIGGPVQIDHRVSRRVRISSDKSLHDLHDLLRQAFDWQEDEPYDFMFGAPYEAGAKRFTGGIDNSGDRDNEVSETRAVSLASLGLEPTHTFGYLFDFGEEWVHRLTVVAVSEVKSPIRSRVVGRKGTPPPQHPEPEDLWEEDLVWTEMDDDFPMTGLYGPYVAEETPDPEMWLAMDELEQQLLVGEAHSQSLPEEHALIESAPLHALVHCLAETQLAAADKTALLQLEKYLQQGISRHEAIHQLGEQLVRETLRRTSRAPTSRKKRREKAKGAGSSPSQKARR